MTSECTEKSIHGEVERPGWLARTESPRYRFGVLVRSIARAALLATSTVAALGCATQRELIDRSASDERQEDQAQGQSSASGGRVVGSGAAPGSWSLAPSWFTARRCPLIPGAALASISSLSRCVLA